MFATSHVLTIHPIMAAKQATTIDHITGGRFALNVVTGWHRPEIEMFGAPLLDHDVRYDWPWNGSKSSSGCGPRTRNSTSRASSTRSRRATAPKPIQKPFPVVMNAGNSDTGRHYAAKYCDIAFVNFNRTTSKSSRRMSTTASWRARNTAATCRSGRNAYVVQGETEKDAKTLFDEYVHQKGDWVAGTT